MTWCAWQTLKGEGHAKHTKPKIIDLLMAKVDCAVSLMVLGVVPTLSKIVHIVCFFVIMWQVINDDDDAGEGNTRSVKQNMRGQGGEPFPSHHDPHVLASHFSHLLPF